MSEPISRPAEAKSGFWAELESFKSPESKSIANLPVVGGKAPSTDKLRVPNGKDNLIVFLRHCGCPFAEKTFKWLAAVSERHRDIHCVAVSHSSREATERWIPQVGGAWQTEMIIDQERDVYAAWGIGLSSTWHAFNPFSLYSVYRLGADEGIWNRATESGSRWQKSGAFAVDRDGVVQWLHVSKAADDLPDFDAAIQSLGIEPRLDGESDEPQVQKP
ncbi:hypothetical protein E4U57_005168 [Claviceps arundinis]|uniref:Thioredoxin domain-containing protein n=1 Tax=Claviceps arundinis TaxID=1623583 RepID=A0ABQ7PN00_9HYPO|nr:hypothetical protein E4U57_005168 [Claviceps arundinis]